ncbi:helix-turn-helix domain-containing protein, partial [Phocaeicola vulgatus]|uniref:helix-turn-helix domain-containing protein n=1 Tax=Phocaeicola vulgatus TaxID=821 RepID=UPI0021095FEE
KVKMIQDRIHVIQDEREFEVLNWLLDGKSYSWIARHMGLSERHIRRIKDSIVEQMSEMPSLPKTS